MKNRPDNPEPLSFIDDEIGFFDAPGAGPLADETVADQIVVHGLLRDRTLRHLQRDEQRVRNVINEIRAIEQGVISDSAVVTHSDAKNHDVMQTEDSLREPSLLKRRSRRIAWASAIAASAASLLLIFSFGQHDRASASMLSLEKIVAAAAKPIDRTYRIYVVEAYPRNKKPRHLSQEAWDRETNQQIDGATLYVRGADQYVLTARLRNGLERTSGCDGNESWAFRENGPVRVSKDLSRFRGGVPGQQQDMTFMNIHSHLAQLRDGYEVELTKKQDFATVGVVLSQLTGARKSRDVRGPKQIEIWFDAENGTIHQMLLDGLPRGGGGPMAVMLELIGQPDLAPNFFSHQSHHEPQRRIRYEEQQQ